MQAGKSEFGDRDTVGKIYRDLQIHGDKTPIPVGDMTNEMMPGLVEDINDGIKEGTEVWTGRPFYLMVHEKKDLQMKSAMLRRMINTIYRPWPEDDTTVFYHDPKSYQTFFCWSLPHHTEMDNILANSWMFDKDLIREITAWKTFNMEHFGFCKCDKGEWVPNPYFKDRNITEFANKPSKIITL